MGFVVALFAAVVTEVSVIIVAFFVVAAIVFSRGDFGSTVFNSPYFLRTVLLAVLASVFVLKQRGLAKRTSHVVGLALLALPVALFVGFTVLAQTSFFAPQPSLKRPPLMSASQANRLEPNVRLVEETLPSGWSVLATEPAGPLEWSYAQPCAGVVVRVYGPETGYRDFTASDSARKKRIAYLNEGRTIWVMPRGFNPKWTYLNTTFASFRLIPIELPHRVGETNSAVLFGLEESVVLPQNEHFDDVTPEGFDGAEAAVLPEHGGSWPSWQEDLSRAANASR